MVDWGAVEAIGTSAAALGTVTVLGFQIRDRARERHDRMRSQAARVQLSRVERADWSYSTLEGPAHSVAVCHVTNNSDDVVSGVVVKIVLKVEAKGREVPTNSYECDIGRMDPKEPRKVRYDFAVPGVTEKMGATWTATASVRFVDAAGRKWFRDAGHKLYYEGTLDDRTKS